MMYHTAAPHMSLPKRQNQQAGRFARVDGIPFTMPVNSEDSPALMAGFTCDGDAAQALLPGNELHAVRLPNGRGMLIVTVIDYRTTDIGRYVEYSIALACTMGAKRRGLISSVVRMNAASMAAFATFVLFSQEVLGIGPFLFSIITIGGAVGAFIGGNIASSVSKRFGSGTCLAAVLLTSAASAAVIGLVATWPVVMIMLTSGLTIHLVRRPGAL